MPSDFQSSILAPSSILFTECRYLRYYQVILIDVLRRAGAEVTVASVEDSLQVLSLLSRINAIACHPAEAGLLQALKQSKAESVVQVDCSRGVKLVADKLIGECSNAEFDVIALPARPTPLCILLRDTA